MDINKILKQAQDMQKKMLEMQEELGRQQFTGTAGGGMVKVTVTGKMEVTNVEIDKSVVDPNDIGLLQDLVVAAFNDARSQCDTNAASSMSGMLGGMGMPEGFQFPKS